MTENYYKGSLGFHVDCLSLLEPLTSFKKLKLNPASKGENISVLKIPLSKALFFNRYDRKQMLKNLVLNERKENHRIS